MIFCFIYKAKQRHTKIFFFSHVVQRLHGKKWKKKNAKLYQKICKSVLQETATAPRQCFLKNTPDNFTISESSRCRNIWNYTFNLLKADFEDSTYLFPDLISDFVASSFFSLLVKVLSGKKMKTEVLIWRQAALNFQNKTPQNRVNETTQQTQLRCKHDISAARVNVPVCPAPSNSSNELEWRRRRRRFPSSYFLSNENQR